MQRLVFHRWWGDWPSGPDGGHAAATRRRSLIRSGAATSICSLLSVIAASALRRGDRHHGRLSRLKADTQVASRFEPVFLTRWTEADAFRAFVMAYGRLLPLRRASAFGEPAMIRTLPQLSGGITGRVTSLLGRPGRIEGPQPVHLPVPARILGCRHQLGTEHSPLAEVSPHSLEPG